MDRKHSLYVFINNAWEEVDLFNDITIPITMKVTDVRVFGSKSSGYSIEFEIPHTNHNAQTFGLVTQLNIYQGSFEVSRDYPAFITDGGITTFEGQFRLKRVIKKHGGKNIYYVGNMFGGAKNFVDFLGNKTLVGNENPDDDLDFSEYFTNADDMTLADFDSYLKTKYSDGTGWGLTLIDKTNKAGTAFSGGSQQWYTDECTPYLYAREIFDRLFYGSGYHYESEFLQGTGFSSYLQDTRWKDTIGKYDVNSLIYPYMRHNSNMRVINPTSSVITQNDTTTSAIISQMQYYKESGLEEADLIGYTVALDANDFTLTEQNVSSSLAAYQFTATANGYYKINWKFDVEGRIQLRNVSNEAPAGFNTINTQGNKPYVVWVQMQKNNSLIGSRVYQAGDVTGDYTSYQEYDDVTQQNQYYVTLHSGTFNYSNAGVWLNIGDTLKLYTWIQCPAQYQVYNSNTQLWETRWVWHHYSNLGVEYYTNFYPKYLQVKLTNNGNPIISNVINNGFYEENDFDPTVVLNQKTTKIDFFNNFVKMFNLYIEDVSGKTNYKTGGIYPPNTLRIEPYEIFYAPELGNGQTNIKDWTKKLDWDTVEYRRCDDYLYNIQNFTKAQDNDFYNAGYNQTYKLPYGNREVVGEYCTKDDKNNVDLKVSASMCGIVNNSTDTLQCPKVFSFDNSNNVDTKKEYSDGIFFIWRNYMNNNSDLGTNYTVKLQSRLSSSYLNVTNYYCADTLNKGYGADDANLNWGGTSAYYQNMKGTIPTYNDLFNAFYAKEYAEKTSTDAIIIKAKAYLTQLDINTVQLSDTIVISDDTYHILEINQWENETTPCEIELIKCRPNFPLPTRDIKPLVINAPQLSLPIAYDTNSLLQQISALESEVEELKTK